jgi:hypothetical protein
MKRTIVAAVVVFAALAGAGGSDLSACGDKSLSAGGIRMQRALAARYPATVLIYAPPASRLLNASHELRLKELLLMVGHQYSEVSTPDAFSAALQTGRYNVVLADLGDVPHVQQEVDSSREPPSLVGVAYHLPKAQAAAAARACRFLIKAPGHGAESLQTIADAVRLRGSISHKA